MILFVEEALIYNLATANKNNDNFNCLCLSYISFLKYRFLLKRLSRIAKPYINYTNQEIIIESKDFVNA